MRTLWAHIWDRDSVGTEQARRIKKRELWAAAYLPLPTALEAMDSTVLVIPRDDRCNMEFFVDLQPIGDGGWVLTGNLQSDGQLGSPAKAFGSNKNSTIRQRNLADWKPIHLDRLFFRSLFRLGCQLKQTLKQEVQANTSPNLQASCCVRLEIIHSVKFVGSWRHVARGSMSRCNLRVTETIKVILINMNSYPHYVCSSNNLSKLRSLSVDVN